MSTGLGGDMFALYYESAGGKITALNGSGRSPAALSLDLVALYKAIGGGWDAQAGSAEGSARAMQ